ncbi:hypothetical protein BC567DRAFT_218971, partial [Phyllosticta citribraziliensis]
MCRHRVEENLALAMARGLELQHHRRRRGVLSRLTGAAFRSVGAAIWVGECNTKRNALMEV